jgi:tetratricopeptide (TPR) repeat protein
MRGVFCLCCLITALTSCRPGAKSVVVSAASASANSGKMPITSQSSEAVALFLRGRILNENLQPHEAFALFQQAVALDPSFAMGEYALASTAPTAKQVRDHLDRAIALADKVSEGERLLIFAMRARIDADPAAVRQYAESLMTRYPRDERAHWVLGNAYSAQQLYVKAIEQYQTAIAINPQYSLAYNSVGYAYRPTGNTAAAEKAFLKYIALVPSDPNPYDSYAELLMAMGRFDESIAQYNKALSIDPHFSGSFVGIAANHMFAGRYPAAIAEAERYFSLARDDHERRAALLTKALIQVDHGATDDALSTMERHYNIARAIGDTASMSNDGMAMADILLDAGRVGAAHERYRQAHDLVAASSLSVNLRQDSDLSTRYNMARVALAMHDTVMAEAEAAAFMHGAEARRNSDRVRQAHELNGLLSLEAQQFDRSLVELALADRQNPAVLYAISMAYDGKGDRAMADQMLVAATHMYTLPTFPYVFVRARARSLPGVRASSK